MSYPVVTFIGAGSTVFTRSLLRDLFTYPELRQCSIRLMDIDDSRLDDSCAVAHLEAERAGAAPEIVTTTDRRTALDGANYVICMVQVGGYQPATVTDFEIPRSFGLRQTIGDTLGIGGIMRGLRTLPVLTSLAQDMEDLCPTALLINYANPMAILMWGLAKQSIRAIGLCHSVQGTIADLETMLDLPADSLEYTCAGINHMAFYLRMGHKGESMYPALRQLQETGTYPAYEQVRFSVLRDFGYFVTESSEHFAEYVPWFMKDGRDDLINRYEIPLDEYLVRCEDQLATWSSTRESLLRPDSTTNADRSLVSGSMSRKFERQRNANPELETHLRSRYLAQQRRKRDGHSGEYGTQVIHAMETGTPGVVYANVNNNGLISNLPSDCCVEVPCLVDGQGVHPVQIGELPPQLASLMATNINVQRMTVEASLSGTRDHVYQAAMLDPHTAAELDPDEIRRMVDALIETHGDLVPAFSS